MLLSICPCRRCGGDEPSPDVFEEIYCLQCGQPVAEDTRSYTGKEGLLHEECLSEYAFTDMTRGELLDFAETQMLEFLQYVIDIRNLRKGGEAL